MYGRNVTFSVKNYRKMKLLIQKWERKCMTSSAWLQQAQENTCSEWKNAKPMEEIPSPPKLPIIGHMNIFTKHAKTQHKFQDEIRKRYGNIVRYRVPGSNIVALYSPEGGSAMYANEGKYPIMPPISHIEFFRYTYLYFRFGFYYL